MAFESSILVLYLYINSTALLVEVNMSQSCKPRVHPGLLGHVCSISWLSLFPFLDSGGHLLSHTVPSAVPSAARALTFVFGMGTRVSPGRIATRSIGFLVPQNPHN